MYPRLLSLLLLLVFTGLLPAGAATPIGKPIVISQQARTGDRFMGVELLGSLALSGHVALAELSALAWDEDEAMLFALSDRGWLLHLQPQFESDRLVQVQLLAVQPLLDARGQPLAGAWRDAEGMTLENGHNGIAGDSRLLISFERHHRIELYQPDGRLIRTLPLPPPLLQPGRKPRGNRGLEAITLHPTLGLMTGPEYPAQGGDHYLVNQHRLWRFNPAEPKGALVALEAMPNGDLVMLQRAFSSLLEPWVISLVRIPAVDLEHEQLTPQPVARFDSSEGWLLQNVEGLSHHHNGRFFLVSDDGNRPWAQTQLIYLRITDLASKP